MSPFRKSLCKTNKRGKRRSAKRHLTYATPLTFAVGFGIWFFYQVAHQKPATEWFEAKANETSKVMLPKDDAPHQAKIEWWYYNGHLTSQSGKQFSFHDTVFLVNGVMSHIVAHVSFNDHQTGRHFSDQRRTGGNPSIGTENRFDFKQGDWLMSGGNGKDRLKAITRNFSFDLNLTGTQPAVLHGEDGVISLAAAGDSYYYSRTRMAVSGTITQGDTTEKVTGVSWFDHQWGDFSVGHLSWDWFSLQLENDIDVMIYQLRDKSNNPVLYMASASQNGNTELLPAAEFAITPGEKWRSDKTGSAYPVAWHISIPRKDIDITTRSIIKNCEFDARLTTYNVYWEGAVKIEGSHKGHGFMELSGYTADNPES